MMEESHAVIEVEIVGEESAGDNNNAGDVPSNPCKLCFDEITSGNKFTLEQCGCFFCNSCMRTYVDLLIKDGVALSISCPDSECVIQGSLEIHEVNTLIDEETYDKYLRLRYEQEVSVDPHRTFCPNPNCSAVCNIQHNRQSQKLHRNKRRKHESKSTQQTRPPVKVSCVTCQLDFCHICKTEWPPTSSTLHKCNDLGTVSSGADLFKWKVKTGFSRTSRTDAVIKRCPVCNTLIEKDRGCAQMICKNCTHVFCWYCLKLLDNDFMLRHYDKGPCKNFLGHSRSQVLRHRLGVIGLFTAFTLLLIVASPILILAAPIFLCCKWKDCCERAWRRAQQENNNALFAEFEMESRNPSNNRTTVQVVSEVTDRGQRSDDGPRAQNTNQTTSTEMDINAHGDSSRRSTNVEPHGGTVASYSGTIETNEQIERNSIHGDFAESQESLGGAFELKICDIEKISFDDAISKDLSLANSEVSLNK